MQTEPVFTDDGTLMNGNTLNIHSLMAASGVRFGTSGVRGLVTSMTDEVCFAYTCAFMQTVVAQAHHAQQSSLTNVHPLVILGHDLRPSSPHIAGVCKAAIEFSGGRVIYAGALPTPAIAYYAQYCQAAAVMVTGSHIPFDRNGIKFYSLAGEISKADEMAIQQAQITMPATAIDDTLPAVDAAVAAHYIQRYTDFFADVDFSGLRVAVYQHSSVARDLLLTLLQQLGMEVVPLGRTDGFVPIDTEAVRPEDVVQAAQWAQQHPFDAILSTDGDADRPLIGDENGKWLRGDITGILCAHYLNADTVVTPVSSSTITERSNWFSHVIRTRIGSPYVIAAMEQASADCSGLIAGFEANGGVLLGTDITHPQAKLTALPTRDAVLPMLAILALTRRYQCTLSALLASLPERYTFSDRLQEFPVEKSTALMLQLQKNVQQLRATMAPGAGDIVATDTTDGLRVTFSNGEIVHVRASGNAPELRCYAEADTEENAKQLCSACLARIKDSSIH